MHSVYIHITSRYWNSLHCFIDTFDSDPTLEISFSAFFYFLDAVLYPRLQRFHHLSVTPSCINITIQKYIYQIEVSLQKITLIMSVSMKKIIIFHSGFSKQYSLFSKSLPITKFGFLGLDIQ